MLNTMTWTVPGMDANTTRIEGLDANTDYIVLVSASNGAGTSKFSVATLSPATPTSMRGILGTVAHAPYCTCTCAFISAQVSWQRI
jgi:hypothetical protein